MPLPLTVSRFSKVQIGFSFLVPAHLDSPGQRAVKRVCVCVCVGRVSFMWICDCSILPHFLHVSAKCAYCTFSPHFLTAILILFVFPLPVCVRFRYLDLWLQQNVTIHVSGPLWNETGWLVSSNSVPYFHVFPLHVWCLCGPHIFFKMPHRTDIPSYYFPLAYFQHSTLQTAIVTVWRVVRRGSGMGW